MKKVLFRETQRYSQGWNLLMILVTHVFVLILMLYALYQQVVRGIPFGDKPAPSWVLVLITAALAGTFVGLLVMKLEVRIDQDGIHYRFFPVIWKEKQIKKAEIERYEIRKFSAVLEYGGRGIRYGMGRKWGKGFIVSGNQGLQLYLTNGKKVLFSTERSQAIIYALDEMMKTSKQV